MLKLDDKVNKAVETTKHMAEKWKLLSDADKQAYIEKSEADKKRNQEEMVKYRESLPPKRPVSAYILYSSSVRDKLRSENPKASITDIAKSIGALWKQLSEADKKPFNKEAHDLYASWIKKKTEWSKTHQKEESTKMEELD